MVLDTLSLDLGKFAPFGNLQVVVFIHCSRSWISFYTLQMPGCYSCTLKRYTAGWYFSKNTVNSISIYHTLVLFSLGSIVWARKGSTCYNQAKRKNFQTWELFGQAEKEFLAVVKELSHAQPIQLTERWKIICSTGGVVESHIVGKGHIRKPKLGETAESSSYQMHQK